MNTTVSTALLGTLLFGGSAFAVLPEGRLFIPALDSYGSHVNFQHGIIAVDTTQIMIDADADNVIGDPAKSEISKSGDEYNYFTATGDPNTIWNLNLIEEKSVSGNYHAGAFSWGQLGVPSPTGLLVIDSRSPGNYKLVYIDLDRDAIFGEPGEVAQNGDTVLMPDGRHYHVILHPDGQSVMFRIVE